MGGIGNIPPEAWDRTHPDHDWWVEGAGRCFADDCPRHPEPVVPAPDGEADSQ